MPKQPVRTVQVKSSRNKITWVRSLKTHHSDRMKMHYTLYYESMTKVWVDTFGEYKDQPCGI